MPNAPNLKTQDLTLEGISDIQAFVLLEETLPSWAEVHAATINKCCYISENHMKVGYIW